MDKSCYCIYKLTPASSLTPTSVGMQNLGRKHRRMLQIRHAHLGNHIYHLLAKHWNKHADQTDNYLLRSNDYPCTTDSGQHDGGILVQIWAYFNISLYEYCQPPQKQSKPELSHYQKPGVSLYWTLSYLRSQIWPHCSLFLWINKPQMVNYAVMEHGLFCQGSNAITLSCSLLHETSLALNHLHAITKEYLLYDE